MCSRCVGGNKSRKRGGGCEFELGVAGISKVWEKAGTSDRRRSFQVVGKGSCHFAWVRCDVSEYARVVRMNRSSVRVITFCGGCCEMRAIQKVDERCRASTSRLTSRSLMPGCSFLWVQPSEAEATATRVPSKFLPDASGYNWSLSRD